MKTKSKHTPLPWNFIMQEDYGNPQLTAVLSGDGSKIADVKFAFLMHPSECHANAQLIVRAINSHDALVEALKMLWGFVEDLSKSNPGYMSKLVIQDYEQWNEAMIKAPAAIAKAGGGAR